MEASNELIYDVIIKNGRVVTPEGETLSDVGIIGEKIASIAPHNVLVSSPTTKVIDATNRIVVPGGIEAHAHVGDKRRPFLLGPVDVSKAAIWGGTTTVVDFANQLAGSDLVSAVEEAKQRWAEGAYTDYTFHVLVTKDATIEHLDQAKGLIEQGFPSFKVFTTSVRPPSTTLPNNCLDFGRISYLMEKLSENKGIMMVHAEDEDLICWNYATAKREEKEEWWRMHHVHDNVSEHLAFSRTINLARAKKCAVYFAHVSASESVSEVSRAQKDNLPIYCETLHNYLGFDAEKYKESDGMKYHTYPSLKSEKDRLVLWDSLLKGVINTVATDLVATSYEIKTKFKQVYNCTGGHNGIETRMGIIFTEGVVKQGMSLETFVNVTSANPAKILGMYPQKGAISVGSDADITIIDPSIHKKLSIDDLHLSDYSIWEGWEIHGWNVTTLLRGKVIIEEGKFMGELSQGKLVHRKLNENMLKGFGL